MATDDPAVLSPALLPSARRDDNGEVSWHLRDAPSVLEELARNGRVVPGLDVRRYDKDSAFSEVAWSVYDGTDPDEARRAALPSLAVEDVPGDWVLITWA